MLQSRSIQTVLESCIGYLVLSYKSMKKLLFKLIASLRYTKLQTPSRHKNVNEGCLNACQRESLECKCSNESDYTVLGTVLNDTVPSVGFDILMCMGCVSVQHYIAKCKLFFFPIFFTLLYFNLKFISEPWIVVEDIQTEFYYYGPLKETVVFSQQFQSLMC